MKPCLLGQVTEHKLHVSADGSCSHATALGAWSLYQRLFFLLTDTAAHIRVMTCTWSLPQTPEGDTWASVFNAYTVNTLPTAAASADPAFAAAVILYIFSFRFHPSSSLLLSPVWSINQWKHVSAGLNHWPKTSRHTVLLTDTWKAAALSFLCAQPGTVISSGSGR